MLGHSSGDELRERLVKLLELRSVLARFAPGSSSESVCKLSKLFLLRFSSRGGITGDSGRDGARRTLQI